MVRFESVKTELFKFFETWTEPNLTTKLFKPNPLQKFQTIKIKLSIFKLGQNSNFENLKIFIIFSMRIVAM